MSVENRKFRNIRLCGNYAAIFWVDHENLHSIPWRCSFVSLCTFILDQIFLMSGIWYLRFVFVCLWRKIVKDNQQDANCLQIYSTGLILLAKLCFSWNDLIHHLSDYLPPLPMGTCTNHVDQKTKCEGPFLPFLRGSSLGLHDHKKVRGSNIYYEMLNHGERGALFDLWGCAIVPYNPQ